MTDEHLLNAERIHAACQEVIGAASRRQLLLLEDDPNAWAAALKWLRTDTERRIAAVNAEIRANVGPGAGLRRRGLDRQRVALIEELDRYADRLRTLKTAGRVVA